MGPAEKGAAFMGAINKIGAVAPRQLFVELGADLSKEELDSPWGQGPLEPLCDELRQAVAVCLEVWRQPAREDGWETFRRHLEELDVVLKQPTSSDDEIRAAAGAIVRDWSPSGDYWTGGWRTQPRSG
jgi:hypothetical protein